MAVEANRANEMLAGLKDKAKEPNSVRVLNSWIDRAEQEVGGERSGRIAWLVATTVVVAKLQQVIDGSGKPRFVMKGGTMLQHRLGMEARSSRDLDGIVTEDLDEFLEQLDVILYESWGPITFRRTPAEVIRVSSKVVKPRRFEMVLELRGKVWRRITVEISPDESGAGASQVAFEAPRLSAFGLPVPDALVGIAMSYQIAQKVHASTDPHDPPKLVNNRARDVVDLVLLKRLCDEAGSPSARDITLAIEDIFSSRMAEAVALGRSGRELPARVVAYPHWQTDYEDAARSAGLDLSLEEAVAIVNEWLEQLGVAD